MMAFIDQNKDEVVDGRRLGVEPICEVLQVALSTYYAARDRPPSERARRDAQLMPRLTEIWKDNYEVYGSRKLWKAARRAGIDIGRDQTARLMRQAGIQGVLRTKRVRTTRRDQKASRHPDLVGRQFTASAPNQLWVTDLTFVATWAGVAYVCFIVDAFSRMIVGWRVAGHMRTPGRDRDGPLEPRTAPPGAALPQRCRIAVHVHPLRRAARGDRRDPVDRIGRRQL
jgi:transposase InsO family protein